MLFRSIPGSDRFLAWLCRALSPLDMDAKSMDTKQSRPIPKIQFRVLIIGRANAGKTTILQRACDTTDSPTIYRRRRNSSGKGEEVRHGCLVILLLLSYPTQVELDPSIEVSDKSSCLLSPLNSESAWRTRH